MIVAAAAQNLLDSIADAGFGLGGGGGREGGYGGRVGGVGVVAEVEGGRGGDESVDFGSVCGGGRCVGLVDVLPCTSSTGYELPRVSDKLSWI